MEQSIKSEYSRRFIDINGFYVDGNKGKLFIGFIKLFQAWLLYVCPINVNQIAAFISPVNNIKKAVVTIQFSDRSPI